MNDIERLLVAWYLMSERRRLYLRLRRLFEDRAYTRTYGR